MSKFYDIDLSSALARQRAAWSQLDAHLIREAARRRQRDIELANAPKHKDVK